MSVLNNCEQQRTQLNNNIGQEIAELTQEILNHYKNQNVEVADSLVRDAVVKHIKTKYPMQLELAVEFQPKQPSKWEQFKDKIELFFDDAPLVCICIGTIVVSAAFTIAIKLFLR